MGVYTRVHMMTAVLDYYRSTFIRLYTVYSNDVL